MDKQILDEHNQIFLDDYNQIYQGLFLHPEAGRDSHLNESLNDIKDDLDYLNDTLKNTGNAVNDLLSNTTFRLNEIKNVILLEKERLQDVQMLCNKYMDFDNVKTLSNIKLSGDFSIENETYYAKVKRQQQKRASIIDVFGNGYEGNEFVYNNYEYQKDVFDTSIRDNMVDNKISTYYEYSRIIVQDFADVTNSYFNKDSEYARCTISFAADDLINYIDINTEDLGISIVNIQTSLDGIKYTSMNMKGKIIINNKLESYNNYGYIYGSGIIEVPLCQYFKITFETNRHKNDVIAYKESTLSDIYTDLTRYEDAKSESWDQKTTSWLNSTGSFILKKDTIVQSAKRSAIKINDIKVYKKIYHAKSIMRSEELITDEAYSISLFANVYIPESLDSKSVEFYLTINGVDYEVVPINSHSNGTKILRFSGGKSSTLYTHLLSEKITSAYLTIVFKSSSELCPMVNNIKILLGGEI